MFDFTSTLVNIYKINMLKNHTIFWWQNNSELCTIYSPIYILKELILIHYSYQRIDKSTFPHFCKKLIIFISITKRKNKKCFKTLTLEIFFGMPRRLASLSFIILIILLQIIYYFQYSLSQWSPDQFGLHRSRQIPLCWLHVPYLHPELHIRSQISPYRPGVHPCVQ